MYCQAYIKNGKLCVKFYGTSVVYESLSIELGGAVTNFAALPEDVYKIIFESLRDAFLRLHNQVTYDDTFLILKDLIVAISPVNPYLNFYMDNFLMYLMSLYDLEHRWQIPVLMQTFLVDGGKGVDLSGTEIVNQKTAANAGLEIFLKDFKKRQSRLKKDFNAISGGIEDLSGLTPMQRLYYLSKQGRNYLSGEFKTKLMPDYFLMPDDLGEIKSTLLEHKVDVVEMIEIETLDDLLSFELYHTLKMELPLRKCKHCDEFFIVRGRVDIEYCDRIKPGEKKPCSIIGATRNYWDNKLNDPIHIEFQKAYKRNHSRQRVGKITQNEFYEWSEEARQKRTDCEAGLLTLDEFKVWLGNKKQ